MTPEFVYVCTINISYSWDKAKVSSEYLYIMHWRVEKHGCFTWLVKAVKYPEFWYHWKKTFWHKCKQVSFSVLLYFSKSNTQTFKHSMLLLTAKVSLFQYIYAQCYINTKNLYRFLRNVSLIIKLLAQYILDDKLISKICVIFTSFILEKLVP